MLPAIGPLLLNNVDNFAEGCWSEAFKNTAGARIEAERPTAIQNYRFWCEDQPEALPELPMHPENVTVWFSLWAGGII